MANESGEKAIASYKINIEKATGKKFEHWVNIVKKSSLQKHGELVNMLKKDHGITHGYANTIVHEAKGSFEGAKDTDALMVNQYKGKENMKSWYEKILKEVSKFGKDVEVSPKKAYVSLVRKKQFAVIQPSTKTRMDIGLNIKNHPASGIVEDGKSWNAMCTHRIKIEDEKDINKEVFSWMKKSYDQAG